MSQIRPAAPGWVPVAVALALVPLLAAPVRDEGPAGLSRDDWSRIRGAVEQASYHAGRVQRPGQTPALVAPNRKQRYRTEFHPDGIRIASQPAAGRDWQLSVHLTGYGYEGDVRPLPAAEPVADEQRVEYRHGPVTEWYENRPGGLEQGFTIAQPAERRSEPLVVALEVEGLGVSVEGRSASFSDVSGQAVVRYGDLRAWDADGRALVSRMEPTDRGVRLLVDAPAARFPLTLDPTFVQEARLTASDGARSDFFGVSVSVSGDTAVVGALFHDVGATADQGAAYVFVGSGGVWSEQQELTASDGALNDRFGGAVSVSGDTAVVGANQDDLAWVDQGSAYVFVRSGGVWSEEQKLTASDGQWNDTFGNAVSLSGDTAVVGAVGAEAAYVFVRSGGVWTQQQKLTASDGAAGDVFGFSVSVSGDTAVVGAFGDVPGDKGAAYVFVRSGGVWSEQQKLTASDGAANDAFGYSVWVSEDTAVVSAVGAAVGGNPSQGAAYVFVRSGGVWSEQQKLTASDGATDDWFGYSASVSGDTAVVGALKGDVGANADQGAAYVFVRSGGAWSEQQKLTASDGAAGDGLGGSVAASGDTIVVGAFVDDVGANADQGSAYVFREPSADLAVTKTDGVDFVAPGGTLTYTITATNAGPQAALGATVTDAFPGTLTCSTTCVGTGAATCTAGPFGGDISDTVNLPAGESVVYTSTCVVSSSASGTLSNTATVTAPAAVADLNPGNNSATDIDAILPPGLSIAGELTHGYVARQDLAALPGPAADVDLFRILQGPHRSYEVLVDGISGDLGSGSGPLLDRLAVDASTVLQASLPAGAGGSRSLRWINALDTPVADELVRVESAGCTTDCDAADVYRLSAWDTTGFIPRFNNSGTQVTVLLLQNLGGEAIDVDVRFWDGSGTSLGGPGLQTLAAHQVYVLDTSGLVPGKGGAITVASTARHGRLVGKAEALEPATGFTFDTEMVSRVR